MEMVEVDGRWRGAALLALMSLLFTPLTILLHELGHFMVPHLAGLSAQLHPTRISGGAALGSEAPWLVALQAGGGPLITALMGLGGAFLYRADARRLWALAFAIAAVSRFLVTTAWLGLRLLLWGMGRPYAGKPNFDEYNMAVAIGVRPELTAIAATLFLAAMLYWLLRRVRKDRRLIYFIVMAAAVLLGNILWPALAPEVLAST